ncbi:MAG: outer membrane beta-barrel protein [Tidjanibacter sp.]|nr:outer membrane beta-barrel protein [Tidjanibacter sp.]
MKRIILFIGCVILGIGFAFAQNSGILKATLKDSKSGEGINGAVIELTSSANGKSQYYTSGYQGKVEIKNLTPTTYNMTITFLGYKEYTKRVKIGAGVNNLGAIKLEEDATIIEQVEINGFLGTSTKGDTVSYNAAAFKTVRDASVEGLLSKMPGITVGGDGSVTAQGESVEKVFVDGKEFFGEDVSTTIKTIPAEMVSKVEVYDKLSDKAEFTGLDDGEGYKAINIVTSLGKRRGVFGKVYGSYGYPDKYSVGGNANLFNGDEKISIIAMANNINQLNFSFEDIVGATSSANVASSGGGGGGMHGGGGMRQARNFMVRPMSGISTVQSVGVNYANQWDKLEVQSSYFFNHSTTINENTTDKTILSSDSYKEHSLSESSSDGENWNHRLNLRLDYKFSKSSSLMVRANASLQQYENTIIGSENISNAATGEALKSMTSENNDERIGTYGNIFALYRTRLGKPGRTITVNSRVNWNSNESHNIPLYSFTIPTDSLYQNIIDNLSGSNSFRAEATYTEPLSKQVQMDFEYEFRHNMDNQNKVAQVCINNVEDKTLSTLLSNISESGYTIHRVGPGINLSTDKVKFNAQVRYQYSSLDNSQTLPKELSQSYNFNDVTYRGNLTVNFNQTNSLRMRLHSRTQNPSIGQLQDATDVNGTSFTAGNPDLKPSYTHSLMTFYTNTNIEKGQTFMLHGGMWLTTRSIASSIQINNPAFTNPVTGMPLGAGETYSRYENISGWNNWNIFTGVSYGFPLTALKSNITLSLNANFNNTPSKINDYLNIMKGQYYTSGVQIGSNVSENLDFTLAYNFSYSINDNSSAIYSQLNRYLSHNARANFKWVAWKGFTLTANATYNQYKGITDSYNEEILLCNAYIGKKLFKDERGELSIGVNDIFNQNRDFRRSVGANYIQNTTNLAIGRYVAVQFVYNIRAFGNGSSAKDFDNIGMGGASRGGFPGGGRPMGPPPHMR